MPPPTPPLMDELVEEVLLRLPPDSLICAGLVCKRWYHLVSDPAFHRRRLDFHGHQAPPMLGFLIYSDDLTDSGNIGARFIPTASSSSSTSSGRLPHASRRGLRPCDARHGRVLLRTWTYRYSPRLSGITIWNPSTGDQLRLPKPPPPPTARGCCPGNWNAAVLCAATGGACDHLDCHRRGGPFIVVFVCDITFHHRLKFTCVYSSQTGAWSEPAVSVALAPHSAGESGGYIASWARSTLLGNALYFVFERYKSILEYDLCTSRTSVIKLPTSVGVGESGVGKKEHFGPIELTTMEDDSRLGFVRVEDCNRLCLWSREEVEEEPDAGWVLTKAIELDRLLLPFDDNKRVSGWDCLVASAEGIGVIFLKLKDDLFTVDLRSGRVTKVYTHLGLFFGKVVVPYMSFCTPVLRTPSTLDGPRTSTSIQ